MPTPAHMIAIVCLTASGLFSTWPALAGVSAEEAARLGKDLTKVGAIAAGNEDGTVPEWRGPAFYSEEQRNYTLEQLEDIRQNRPKELEDSFNRQYSEFAEPLYTVTKANMAQYADQLSDGHKALLERYPGYKMIVYPTARSAFWPDFIEDATVANAQRASLEGSDLLKGAKLGFPFPIPKSGAEVMWNHKLRYRGTAARRYNNQAIVRPDGDVLLTKIVEDVKFKYANPDEADTKGLFAFYLSTVESPARLAGQITLVHEVADISEGGRLAWIFTPGLGRVIRAPDVGYDNPAPGTDGEQFTDQVDVFNGSMDRYTWNLVGRKEILIPYNAYLLNSPRNKYKELLTPLHLNQDYARYELHRVWIVDAELKSGTRHQFKKRRFYVDEDAWSIAIVDCYDNRDQLWKVQEAHQLTAPFIPTTNGAPEVIYDLQSKRYFVSALSMEEKLPDFEIEFKDSYFDPSALKRRARR